MKRGWTYLFVSLILAIAVSGCALFGGHLDSLLELGREQACEVDEHGNYTGDPKPDVAEDVADAIVEAAEFVGVELDEAIAEKVAEEVLKVLCAGGAVDTEHALHIVLPEEIGYPEAAMIIDEMRTGR